MYVNIGATDRIHLCNIYYKCNITYIYIYIIIIIIIIIIIYINLGAFVPSGILYKL